MTKNIGKLYENIPDSEVLPEAFSLLDKAKSEFEDVLYDFPYPKKERNDKLVELIIKWFGE